MKTPFYPLLLSLLVPALVSTSLSSARAMPLMPTSRAAICDDEDAIDKLFERASNAYGDAENVKINYTSVVKTDGETINAHGNLIFEAPARFHYDQEIDDQKITFVYDGYALMMQKNAEKASRVIVNPNETAWDALPGAALPDPFIDSFLAGENPFDDYEGDPDTLKKLSIQTINGAPCDGVELHPADSLSITAWFNRATGLLQRVITRTTETSITSNYMTSELNATLAPGTFVLNQPGARNTAFEVN